MGCIMRTALIIHLILKPCSFTCTSMCAAIIRHPWDCCSQTSVCSGVRVNTRTRQYETSVVLNPCALVCLYFHVCCCGNTLVWSAVHGHQCTRIASKHIDILYNIHCSISVQPRPCPDASLWQCSRVHCFQEICDGVGCHTTVLGALVTNCA